MKAVDFFDLRNQESSAKDTNYPYLRDVSEVQFRRKSTKMFWKTSFEDESYKSGQFLQKKYREMVKKQVLLSEKGPERGVTLSKKNDILYKLTQLMPENRRQFWLDLSSNELSKDLSVNYEHIQEDEL